MYGICAEYCYYYNAYDATKNKCVYNDKWCEKYIMYGSPSTCVNECDEGYDYINGTLCTTSCDIYEMNTEINKY